MLPYVRVIDSVEFSLLERQPRAQIMLPDSGTRRGNIEIHPGRVEMCAAPQIQQAGTSRPVTCQRQECSRFIGGPRLFHPDTRAIYRVELELHFHLLLEILDGASAAFPIAIIINLNPPSRHYLIIQATKDLLRGFIPITVHV